MVLVSKAAPDVTEAGEAIEGTLKDRHKVIRDFGERLEGLEQNRARTAGGELRNLVDTLLRIAFKSPGEIERVDRAEGAEAETTDPGTTDPAMGAPPRASEDEMTLMALSTPVRGCHVGGPRRLVDMAEDAKYG